MAGIECYETGVLGFPVRCYVARQEAVLSIRIGSPTAKRQPFATFGEIIPFEKWRRDGLRLLRGGGER